MTSSSLDIQRRSASPTAAAEARNPAEIAQLIDVSVCIGCKACQVACSEWNELRADVGTCVGVYDNPTDLSSQAWTVMRFAEVEENGKLEWLIRKDGCMHCAEPGCLKACPSPGAIVQHKNGIVDYNQDNCIGCGYCVSGCPFNVPRLSPKDGKAYKCNMCSDRVAVGLEPACVKTCPTGAIQFGSKEDMKEVAATRIADLQSRGFQNAGLYDPPGVGGTHTMYVLHHADKPEQYSGLPNDPSISTAVGLWKGALKPLATVGIAAAGLFGFFHYITVGPNRADDDAHHDAHHDAKADTREEDRS
ncbi:formate dehydrogenase subunit beta [Azospirillum sp. A29]|uniref:formate dehydrogenase subunit beta n=1 Tax=Azospirillum sp. A29 TaxID=3160606 RepID=UPI00366E2BFC